MKTTVAAVTESFTNTFSKRPDVVGRAPGRINIIGEHTDYTGGYVLPAAIDRDIVFAASRTGSGTIEGLSVDFGKRASCPVGEYDPSHPEVWFRYIMGVLSELGKDGRDIGGFTFAFAGDIPIGAGLSSSAALETAVLTVMEELFGFSIEDTEAALLCQRAENNFVGMNCGIMDQYISRMGVKDHALFIDCSDLSCRTVAMDLPDHTWVVIDSKKQRGLVDSEYNRRRRECEEALAVARENLEEDISSLQDVMIDDLPALKHACEKQVFKRLHHVVTENDRVISMVKALETGNTDGIGDLLYGSHESLRNDFEVSCVELDTLVDILSDVDGVAGARMTGAGFGGCVIALVEHGAVGDAGEAVESLYRPDSLPPGTAADIWPVEIADGAETLDAG